MILLKNIDKIKNIFKLRPDTDIIKSKGKSIYV